MNESSPAQTRESQRAPFSQPLEGRKGEVSEGLASAGAVDDREGATSAAGARLVALHVANFFPSIAAVGLATARHVPPA